MPHNIDTQLLCAHTLEIGGKRRRRLQQTNSIKRTISSKPEVIYQLPPRLHKIIKMMLLSH